MVLGDGLMARALLPDWAQRADICIFARGVSDSGCTDPAAFRREQGLIDAALAAHASTDAFVYFGTCSANAAPEHRSAYVRHKVAMEQRVLAHPRGLVLRLPQVAGRGGNPRTLLNHLGAQIASGNPFEVWARARRRVIDIDDVARLTRALIATGARGRIVDLAPPRGHRVEEIVQALEDALGCPARYRIVDQGHDEPADAHLAVQLGATCGVRFDTDYLRRIVMRRHGRKQVTG
jgi:nucleoside-diphosphate-sugar epimerase